MGILKIKSAAKVAEEEALLAQAKKVCAEQPRTNDDTDYRAAQVRLHDKAHEIRQYLLTTYPSYCEQHPVLKTFRGAYGYSSDPETREIELAMNLAKEKGDTTLIYALLELSQIDNELMYEAEKLVIKSPRPWWESFSDELGPYPYETTNSSAE